MKKKIIHSLLTIFGIIAVLNYTPVKGILDFGREYHYTTLHGEATAWEMPSKGHDYENVQEGFNNFKQKNPLTSDTVLYRTFTRNPVRIWHYHDYLFHPRYKLPYLDEQTLTEKQATSR